MSSDNDVKVPQTTILPIDDPRDLTVGPKISLAEH